MKYPKSIVQEVSDLWLKMYRIEKQLEDIEREITELNITIDKMMRVIREHVGVDPEVMENEL